MLQKAAIRWVERCGGCAVWSFRQEDSYVVGCRKNGKCALLRSVDSPNGGFDFFPAILFSFRIQTHRTFHHRPCRSAAADIIERQMADSRHGGFPHLVCPRCRQTRPGSHIRIAPSPKMAADRIYGRKVRCGYRVFSKAKHTYFRQAIRLTLSKGRSINRAPPKCSDRLSRQFAKKRK